MKAPIILRADDGLSWWSDPGKLGLALESPDIEDGIYHAWDAEGQILKIAPLRPVVHRSFFGLRTVSVSPGVVSGTGLYEPDVLQAVLAEYIADMGCPTEDIPKDLDSAVERLCRQKPSRDAPP